MATSSSLVFKLFGEDISASRTLDKVGVEAEGLSGKFGKLGAAGGAALAGIAVAAGAVGAASVKMAMDFDQQMARLSTQAGVPKAAIKGLSDQVLGLAGQVGFAPKSLAESLFHVESSFASTGITAQKAMDMVKVAAEGAAIGGSDLVDTTNALTAAIASGIKGAQDYTQTMGALNAIVGSGDMTMQDLADAINTGFLSVVKAFGVTLPDVSAALATFGDAGIRGSDAATGLRMAIQAMAHPAVTGKAALDSVGLSTRSLAKDMQQGGLNQALQDLVKHMTNAGVTGNQVGKFITDAFGRKSSSTLAVLTEQFSRFESKYGEVNKQATGFADAWKQQQQQFSQQLKQLEAGFEAIGIKIGNFLIPKIQGIGKAIGDAWHSLNQKAGGQQSILKEFMTGFHNPAMTNFDSGFGGSLEKIGVAAHNLGVKAHALWGEFTHNLKPILHDLWNFIVGSLLPSLQNLWTAALPSLKTAAHDVFLAFKGISDILVNYAGPALATVTKWMADHKQGVKDFATVAGGMLLVWEGYTVWIKAQKAADALAASIKVLRTESALGLKVTFLAGISLGLYELYTQVATFRHGLEGFAGDAIMWGDGILVGFKAVVDGVYTMVESILSATKLLGPLDPLKGVRKGVEKTKSEFDTKMEGIIQSVHGAANHMYDLSKGVHDSTSSSIVDIGKLKASVDGLHDKKLIISVIDNAKSILDDIHTAAAGLINLGFTPQGATNTIKAGNYADGGLIRGPGGPRQDNHLIRASAGEFVVNAAATSANLPLLQAINAKRFADGGLVDRLTYDATPTVQEMGKIFHSGFGGPVGAIGGGAGRWLGVVLQALALNGASAMWAPRVLSQIQFESGGDPNIHQQVIDINTFNGSGGAQGLMQVLLATFLSNHVPGTSMNIFDPLANVAAGIHHAIHEDPGGLSYLGQGHGYAMGGFAKAGRWITAGEAGPESIYVGQDAHIVSNRDSVGGNHYHYHIGTVIGTTLDKAAGELMEAMDRRVARGGSVPATFRRR